MYRQAAFPEECLKGKVQEDDKYIDKSSSKNVILPIIKESPTQRVLQKVIMVKAQETVHFADEQGIAPREETAPWKILIADDEDEIHAITRIVLENLVFEERPVLFLSAYSGVETMDLLREHPDTAVVLLDVVMEEETTGLKVARAIREELRNRFVRIVLRTGQPGQAPERQVTMDYDINDYKEKTELTVPKLFTTVIGALRAYRDLKAIEKSRNGLQHIVRASANLFELQSLEQFATFALSQFVRVLDDDSETPPHPTTGFVTAQQEYRHTILCGIGPYHELTHTCIDDIPAQDITALLSAARQTKQSIFSHNRYVGYFRARNGMENLLYLQGYLPLHAIDQELIRIFSNNLAVAFDNIYLNQSIIGTQREVIFTLGQIIETRSKETGNHVKRVAAYSHLIARKAGLNQDEAELLRLASPLHDVGKIGVPDAILDKPIPLTAEEYRILQLHPTIGYNILKDSKQAILKTAATIALQHHEHWDGSGYPHGLSGEEIHIFARITRLADMFDTLCHQHSVEDPWDLDRIVAFLRSEQSRQLDPQLVELFCQHLPEILALKDAYPEPELLHAETT